MKIDPKSTLTVAPVVFEGWCLRRGTGRPGPSEAPSTIPVARSRPRGLRMPISSMFPAATS